MTLHLAPVSAAGRALHAFADAHPRLGADSLRPYVGILGVLLGSIIATLGSRVTSFGLADLRGGLQAGFDEGAGSPLPLGSARWWPVLPRRILAPFSGCGACCCSVSC